MPCTVKSRRSGSASSSSKPSSSRIPRIRTSRLPVTIPSPRAKNLPPRAPKPRKLVKGLGSNASGRPKSRKYFPENALADVEAEPVRSDRAQVSRVAEEVPRLGKRYQQHLDLFDLEELHHRLLDSKFSARRRSPRPAGPPALSPDIGQFGAVAPDTCSTRSQLPAACRENEDVPCDKCYA